MKYFNTDTNIAENKKIQNLIRKEGVEAFGLWKLTLSIVARDIDIDNSQNGYLKVPGGKSHVDYISFMFEISEDRVIEIFDTCADLELIDPGEWEDKTLFFPNLLKRKQVKNYLKKQEGGRKGGKKGKPERTPSKTGKSNPPSNNNDNNDDKDNDKNKEKIKDIYEHWNKSGAGTNHRKMEPHESSINARLEDFAVDEIKKAIDNLAKARQSEDYYWTHKWTLKEFLSRQEGGKVEQFLEGIEQFKKENKQNEQKESFDHEWEELVNGDE